MIINDTSCKKLLYVFHYVALFISVSSVIYTLVQMTDNLIMQCYWVLFAVFVEFFAQLVRGLAKSFRRLKNYWAAVGLWLIYMIYVVIFAFLSALGVFIAENNLNDQKYEAVTFNQEQTMNEIKQLNQNIETLQNQQKLEGGTGTGPKFKYLQDQINEAIHKRDALQNKIGTNKTIKKGSVFVNLKREVNIPSNWFKILMFGSAALMVYTCLIITPWEINLPDPTKRPAKKEDKNDEPRKVGTLTLAQKRREQLGGQDNG